MTRKYTVRQEDSCISQCCPQQEKERKKKALILKHTVALQNILLKIGG